MKSIVVIHGHIGNPGELKPVGDTHKLGFTLAGNRRQKKGNEWVDAPTWWNVTVWGKKAEYLADKISKGVPVTVIGEPYLEPWTTKEGDKRETLRVEADQVEVHARRVPGSAAPAADPAGPPSEHPPRSPRPAGGGDDEPPF